MTDEELLVYLREAATQTRFALNAANSIGVALNRQDEALEAGDQQSVDTLHREVFRSIHSLLAHASNVSKIFWPAGGSDDDPRLERAARLREELDLPDEDHPLRSRPLRQHLERFDERLDEWRKTSDPAGVVQDYIGPPGGRDDVDEGDRMRAFDPSTGVFRFRGEEYPLDRITGALKSLDRNLGRVERELWNELPSESAPGG